jgi:uncharacterized MAPEG superfamily protein
METAPLYLVYLGYVSILTGLLWIPYILDRIAKWGLAGAVGYPENPPPQSPWAQRMMKAHHNAVENLVVFAALLLAAHVLGASGSVLAIAAIVYFWARLVHAIAYTLGIPWVRTLAFTAGFLAQASIAWQVIAR